MLSSLYKHKKIISFFLCFVFLLSMVITTQSQVAEASIPLTAGSSTFVYVLAGLLGVATTSYLNAQIMVNKFWDSLNDDSKNKINTAVTNNTDLQLDSDLVDDMNNAVLNADGSYTCGLEGASYSGTIGSSGITYTMPDENYGSWYATLSSVSLNSTWEALYFKGDTQQKYETIYGRGVVGSDWQYWIKCNGVKVVTSASAIPAGSYRWELDGTNFNFYYNGVLVYSNPDTRKAYSLKLYSSTYAVHYDNVFNGTIAAGTTYTTNNYYNNATNIQALKGQALAASTATVPLDTADDMTYDQKKAALTTGLTLPTDTSTDTGLLSNLWHTATDIWDSVRSLPATISTAISAASSAVFDSPTDFALDFSGFKNLIIFDKFPFSIPFDLVNAVKLFAASASDYQLKLHVNLPHFKVNYDLDMSPYYPYIAFARYVFVVFFAIGLIMRTRDLIKW